MHKTYYIGLDVHKQSVAVAYTHEGSRAQATYHGTSGGTNTAVEGALRLLAKKLGVKIQDFHICYEADPTGFVLARRLLQLKVETTVMSPCKTERRPNEKINTDFFSHARQPHDVDLRNDRSVAYNFLPA